MTRWTFAWGDDSSLDPQFTEWAELPSDRYPFGAQDVGSLYIRVLEATLQYTDVHGHLTERHYQLVQFQSGGFWRLYRVRQLRQWNTSENDRYEMRRPDERLFRLENATPYRMSVGGGLFDPNEGQACVEASRLIIDDYLGGIRETAGTAAWEYLAQHGLGPLAGFPEERGARTRRLGGWADTGRNFVVQQSDPPGVDLANAEPPSAGRRLPDWIVPNRRNRPGSFESDGYPSWDELERKYLREYQRDVASDPVETINPTIDRTGEPFGSLPESESVRNIIAPPQDSIRQPATGEPQPVVWEIYSSRAAQRQMDENPKLKRCQCGDVYCDGVTRRTFAPGHDAKLVTRLLAMISGGQLDRDQAVRIIRHVGGSAALSDKFERAYWKLYHANWSVRIQADRAARDLAEQGGPEFTWYAPTETLLLTVEEARDGTPRGMASYEVIEGSGERAWVLKYLNRGSGNWTTMEQRFQYAEDVVAWDAYHGRVARSRNYY